MERSNLIARVRQVVRKIGLRLPLFFLCVAIVSAFGFTAAHGAARSALHGRRPGTLSASVTSIDRWGDGPGVTVTIGICGENYFNAFGTSMTLNGNNITNQFGNVPSDQIYYCE